jgi:hypothetical protein
MYHQLSGLEARISALSQQVSKFEQNWQQDVTQYAEKAAGKAAQKAVGNEIGDLKEATQYVLVGSIKRTPTSPIEPLPGRPNDGCPRGWHKLAVVGILWSRDDPKDSMAGAGEEKMNESYNWAHPILCERNSPE